MNIPRFRSTSFIIALTLVLALAPSPARAGAGLDNGGGQSRPAESSSYAAETKLAVGDAAYVNRYGYAVAIEGATVVVGAPSGSAHVFVRDGDGWVLRQRLTPSDGAPSFGISVAVSGDTIVVGAYGDQNAGNYSGAAYVFVREGTTWTQQQKLVGSGNSAGDCFGLSVGVEGDTAVVGAFGDNDVEGAFSQGYAGYGVGSAYVFTREDGVWTERQKLRAGDAAPDSNFGLSVGLSGNSVVVGAYGDSAFGHYAGAAYVFVKGPSGWTEQQKLAPRDAAEGLQLGYRVAISGNTVVASAPGDARGTHAPGAAYVFERKGGVWAEQKKLFSRNAQNSGDFGLSVAIRGDTIALGCPLENGTGAVYVYGRNGVAGWTERRKIVAGDGALYDFFGSGVAVGDGAVVAGAPQKHGAAEYSGAAYVYQ